MRQIKITLYSIILITCTQAIAAEGQFQIIDARSFAITIQPADELAKTAEVADLYISRFPERGWTLHNACRIERQNQNVLFKATVRVESDGTYYFTTRHASKGQTPEPPTLNAPAQAVVIVDTQAPSVEWIAPLPPTVLRAGELSQLRWLARDLNFGKTPVTISYTIDHGDTWLEIARNLPPEGVYDWKVPDTKGKAVMLRLEAIDKAGHASAVTLPAALRVYVSSSAGTIPTPDTDRLLKEPLSAAESPAKLERDSTVRVFVEPLPETTVSGNGLPPTRYPELTANGDTLPVRNAYPTPYRAAYIAYIMGGNLVKQNRLKDSLRYFRTAVDTDESFHQAWSEMAMVYNRLGDYGRADMCILRALRIEPKNPEYIHNRGEIYHAKGIQSLLKDTEAEVALGDDSIHFAIKLYGMSIDEAERLGRLEERAASYFRLGEICYFVNKDAAGAKQYWKKVTALHSPTPELDDVVHDQNTPEAERSLAIYRRRTELKVQLLIWQSWARDYLQQLNDYETGAQPKTDEEKRIERDFAIPTASEQHNKEWYPNPKRPDDFLQVEYGRVLMPKADYVQPGYGSTARFRPNPDPRPRYYMPPEATAKYFIVEDEKPKGFFKTFFGSSAKPDKEVIYR